MECNSGFVVLFTVCSEMEHVICGLRSCSLTCHEILEASLF